MEQYMRVNACIDLDAIHKNLMNMKENISPTSKLMAVIKTDGYGHGAVTISKEIESLDYLYGFAVATVEEAIILRKSGITKPILVLGFTFPNAYKDIVRYDIRPAVFKYSMAEELSKEAVSQGKIVHFHIKIDTGMGRIGFQTTDESIAEIIKIAKLQNVETEGIFTHFSKADMSDKEPTFIQINKFHDFIERLSLNNICFQIHHCSNSAGIVEIAKANYDMVRAGITLYGLWPSDEVRRDVITLYPVMSIISHIAYIKEVEAGTPISYGGTYIAPARRKIATIPVGYGDGYPRGLSGKGSVLIRGKRAPICGRVCMDQFMVDVTDIADVREFDPVTLMGKNGQDQITAEELGELSGRFNYELVCDIGKRVPRTYYKNGEIVFTKDYFQDYL